MSGARCPSPRKMMGRGADGGCGAVERLAPLSKASSSSSPRCQGEAAVDLFAQARKALAERCPFDDEAAASRAPTLPAALASVLARYSDGRRKHKKVQVEGEAEAKAKPVSTRSQKAPNLWAETEEYFRPLTLVDIDMLAPKSALVRGCTLDSCLSIPLLGSASVKEEKKCDTFSDAVTVQVSLGSVPVSVRGTEKVELAKEEEKPTTMDIDVGVENEEEDECSSMHWVLGLKSRHVLTSERPSKKRKLLGEDAGLDQLLVLPHSVGEESLSRCDVCCLEDRGVKSNQLLCCDSCNVLVHQKCYGAHEVPEGPWLCSWCRHFNTARKSSAKNGEDSGLRPCVLCPKEGGALKPNGGDSAGRSRGGTTTKFSHLFCSIWAPEVYVDDTGAMEPVLNVGGVQETRKKLVCNVCKVKYGACIRCSHGTCRTSFHPICAREAKHRMEIWGKFTCDNVELRAFCSKHSPSLKSGRGHHSENLTTANADNSSVTKPTHVTVPPNKLPKLRLSRKNKDISLVQNKSPSLGSEKITGDDINVKLEGGGQPNIDEEAHNIMENGNSLSNTVNLAIVLKKLIDREKIDIHDFASEMGISSESLKSALVGETSSFSPGLRSKIIKWLQNSVHMPFYMQHMKSKSGSAVLSRNKLAKAKVDDPDTVKISDSDLSPNGSCDVPINVLVKSLPPRRRTKSSIGILKDKVTFSSSKEKGIHQNGNGRLDKPGKNPEAVSEDIKGNMDDKGSQVHDQDGGLQGQELAVLVREDDFASPASNSTVDVLLEQNENTTNIKNCDSSEIQHQSRHVVDEVSPSDLGMDKKINPVEFAVPKSLEKNSCEHPGCDANVVLSGTPDFKFDESGSGAYLHPIVKKRLLELDSSLVFKQKHKETVTEGHRKKDLSFTEAAKPACTSSKHEPQHFTWSMENVLNASMVEQLSKAESLGILELSPQDEVEGEILYLQTRLLDNAVILKNRCEDLIFETVRNLPQELNAVKRQRWDHVLVNQFLREVREAKKRGRKERKHREAQAVLAAAAAAAAASSRNSSLRKDTVDEMNSESPLKVGTVPLRAVSPLLPRAKETARSAVAKRSLDKQSGSFQIPEFSKESALSCEICGRTETLLNRVFVCSSCKVAVHLDCYRKLKNPIGSWKCELCEEMSLQSRSPKYQTMDSEGFGAVAHCGLCGGAGGAFRKSVDGQWVHAFCAEWLLESSFRRGQQNVIQRLDDIAKDSDLLYCNICHQKVGLCLKCSYGQCQITFHPTCARSARLYMNVKAIGGRLQHKAYCEKHSLEQREADNQQCEAEELKNVRQIRVELEKLRLLCERILKREKLKRDLVLCSHEILASRRDHLAYSMLVRGSFFPPGVSSESATTSINNKSYSETIQRSDDITVDSTVSGKRNIRLPMHVDVDRKTDDSSTSQVSVKRKLADRGSFSGKQLPGRPASAPCRETTEDGEKRSKGRKHVEVFQKELVMTSDEASMQNQRLPKGFAYVPIGSLTKEKPVIHDPESREQEPGG